MGNASDAMAKWNLAQECKAGLTYENQLVPSNAGMGPEENFLFLMRMVYTYLKVVSYTIHRGKKRETLRLGIKMKDGKYHLFSQHFSVESSQTTRQEDTMKAIQTRKKEKI